MTVLPIVERELRIAARKRSTYVNRTLSAGVALGVFAWLCLVLRGEQRELGMVLFWSLTVLSFLGSLFMGIVYTADCVSEEKREGTLGLLFLTDLKGYDVVLGKLAASSVSAVCAVLAVFPVLALPLLLGSVTAGEFWRVVAVLANTLFFSLAAGVLASASVRGARAGMSLTFLLILLVNGVGPAFGVWLAYKYQLNQPPDYLLIPSAGYACAAASDALYGTRKLGFWTSIGVIHAMGWIFLILAGIIARHSWQERAPGVTRDRLQKLWRRMLYGGAEVSRAVRHQLLGINPCLWLTARHRFKTWLVWGFLALAGFGFLLGWLEFENDWLEMPIYVMTALVLHTALRAWCSSEAVLCLGPDRRSGALELLLSTPLSVPELLRGHHLALQRQFLKPALVLVFVDILFLVAGLEETHGSTDQAAWIWTWIIGIGVFLLDLQTMAWLGMWFGLRMRQMSRAAGQACAVVFVLPWALYGLFFTLLWLLEIPLPDHEPVGFLLGTYVVISVAVDVVALRAARHRLRRDLRRLATERVEAAPSLLARVFGRRSEGPA